MRMGRTENFVGLVSFKQEEGPMPPTPGRALNRAAQDYRVLPVRRRGNEEPSAGDCYAASVLVGDSPAMARLFAVIERIAPSNSSVLITGATGTGKEMAARAIHEKS